MSIKVLGHLSLGKIHTQCNTSNHARKPNDLKRNVSVEPAWVEGARVARNHGSHWEQ